MLVLGQLIEGFGLLVLTGNLNWINRGYAISAVGLGLVCMGISQCII
jgi:hypothetical protein